MKKFILGLAVLLSITSAQAAFTSGPYITGRAAFNHTEYKTETSNKKTVFADAFAIGARSKLFRMEFEFANTLKAKFDDMRYNQFRYTLQTYFDLPLRSVIRPFVNLGCGIAQTEAQSKGGIVGNRDDDDASFTWNFGGGLALDLTKAWSLDLGYRYIMPNKAKLFGDKVKMRTHEGYLGIRYTF